MPIAADPQTWPPGNHVSPRDLVIDFLTGTLGYTQVVKRRHATPLGTPPNLVDLLRTAPVIVVDRFGGADATITIDVARLDIDVYANDEAAAETHSETIRTAMRTRLPGHLYRGAVVNRVATVSAPTEAPYDSRNTVWRFTAAYQVTVHTYSGVA